VIVLAASGLRVPPPLAVYVHVPWCERKCPYCDFNSHSLPGKRSLPDRAFVRALAADLAAEAGLAPGREVQSVYLGGGTPSLLAPESVGEVLAAIARHRPVAPGVEVTLEANPGTVDSGRLEALRAVGVTRLSIGIQSLDDGLLARLGRIHSARQGREAVEAARAAGFEDVNLDLMYGLPGQTPAAAERDLREAIALAPDHISHYQLTIEDGTPFARSPPTLPDEEAVAETEERCRDLLAGAGFARYEVSAFARARRHCRHNLIYWSFGDYLGVGPGAHGKVSEAQPWRVTRRVKHRLPDRYLRAAADGGFLAEERVLGTNELVVEFMLNALRLVEGVPASSFSERTGIPLERIEGLLQAGRDQGLLAHEPRRIRATPLGLRFLHDLLGLFVAD
jgi:oxygen-independent coproporphyrinogen-3 oxidase